MTNFADQQCKAGVTRLSADEAEAMIGRISSAWRLDSDNNSISRLFKFKNYYETLAFVNVVAMIAHQQDHHPEMTVNYNTCRVEYSTHSVGGLSENDFICAAKADRSLNI